MSGTSVSAFGVNHSTEVISKMGIPVVDAYTSARTNERMTDDKLRSYNKAADTFHRQKQERVNAGLDTRRVKRRERRNFLKDNPEYKGLKGPVRRWESTSRGYNNIRNAEKVEPTLTNIVLKPSATRRSNDKEILTRLQQSGSRKTVYRGYRNAPSDKQLTRENKLSSWTTDDKVASNYSNGKSGYRKYKADPDKAVVVRSNRKSASVLPLSSYSNLERIALN